MVNVKVKLLNSEAKLPKRATEGAACFDLQASEDVKWIFNGVWVATVKTGLAFSIPKGYRMDIYVRSGLAFKNNISLMNGVGKIDSDYRGEVMVKLVYFGRTPPIEIKKGDRIAQAEINKVLDVEFETVDELDDTNRGEGGFGSTGV
jgi:dUTP pyrophosphatase